MRAVNAGVFSQDFEEVCLGDGEGIVDVKKFVAWICSVSERSIDYLEMPSPSSAATSLSVLPPETEPDMLEIDLSFDLVDDVFAQAKEKFEALDKDSNGVLDAKELREVCSWVFTTFGKTFCSKQDREKAIERQVQRFEKKTTNGSGWDFAAFEAYYRKVIEDSELYQLKRCEAYKSGYDKSAAAQKFREFDKDGNGALEGMELMEFATWVFTSFRPDGAPLTEEQCKAEARKLIHRLDEKKGNADGKLSFTEVDFYFADKIKQIEVFQKRVAQKTNKSQVKTEPVNTQ